MARFERMDHNMTSVLLGIFGVAEPTLAMRGHTLHYTFRIMNSAILAGKIWEREIIKSCHFFEGEFEKSDFIMEFED